MPLDPHLLRNAFVAIHLERLAAEIMEQGQAFLADGGVAFPPRAASTVLLLGDEGAMSAADLARRLGQPHQLVTQRLDLLLSLGVVVSRDDPKDARRKVLNLTPLGEEQFARLRARLAVADVAFGELFAELGCDLAEVARRGLAALQQTPLTERARRLHAQA